jgi:pimeloyl-ACP methyl ester carboxylesterase
MPDRRIGPRSSSAQLTEVADTGHHIELDQPLQVIDQIQRLWRGSDDRPHGSGR